MDITYVKEFSALAEILNYKKAAENLFISQTTLFNHIKALENELGVPLFLRDGKRITLSEYGILFQPYARAIIGNTEQFEQEITERKARSGHILRVGSQYRITKLIQGFKQHHKDCTVHDLYAKDPESALYQSEYDLAFICGPVEEKDKYHVLPYIADSSVIVVPSSHPLAKRKSVALIELREEEFVQYLTPEGEETEEMKLCEQAGFKPKAAAIVNGPEAIRLVHAGIGIMFTNKKSFLISEASTDGVVLLDLDPPIPCNVSLYWRKDKKPSALCLAFIDYVKHQSMR